MSNTVNYLAMALFGFLFTQTANAQSDTITIEGKGQKRVIILDKGEETKVVLKDEKSRVVVEMESESLLKKDSGVQLSYEFPNGKVKINNKKKNYSVNFLSDFSIGFANAANQDVTNIVYDPYLIPELNDGLNFSMNIFKQEVNLLKHQLYLTTAIGVNNYYYSLKNKRLVPTEDLLSSVAPRYIFGADSSNATYKTNRVDSRFYSIPILLKWEAKNKKKHGRFALATGVELNFNNRVLSKLKIKDEERRLKDKTNLGIAHSGIVPAYILKIQYGSVGVFGRFVPGGVIPNATQAGDVYSFGLSSQF